MQGNLRPRFAERQPLFWAALAFAFGICAGTYLASPAFGWLAMVIVFAIASLYSARRSFAVSRLIGLAAVAAAAAFMVKARPAPDPGNAVLPYANRQGIKVTAHVIREGNWQPREQNEFRQLLDLETEEVTVAGRPIPVQAGIRIAIYSDDDATAPLFPYGQRLQFSTKLAPPHNFQDPGVFDYKAYLNENGIAALGSAKATDIEVLPGFAGNRIEQWRARAHRSVLQKIHSLWQPADADLLNAMVAGDESFVSHTSRMEFQRTGTYHLLVVSGMNVGILAFVTFWALRRLLRIHDFIASFVTVVVITSYAFLTNVGPPVWRATFMLTLFLGARFLYRQRSMLNAIGIAALGVLLWDPRAFFGASFQMTFLCVLIIAGICVPILERTSQPYVRGLRQLPALAYDRACPPRIAQFRLDIRMIARRLGRFVDDRVAELFLVHSGRFAFAFAEVLFVSLLMQLGMALPMAYYFHRVTVTALPANILVLPLTEIMMPAAVLATTLGYVWTLLAKIPVAIAALSLHAITGTIHILGRLRIADLRVPTPALAAILFCSAAMAISMLLAWRRALLASTGLLLIALGAAWIAVVPPRPKLLPNNLEVTAIDVGQGDSLFLAFPNGRTALVDAGGMPGWTHSEFDIGEEVVSPYLWSRGVGHLDMVEVTHPHADHIGGMYSVLANFHPRELWVAKDTHSPEMDALIREANAFGVKVLEYQSGDARQFGGASIRFLAPVPGVSDGKRENEESLVMKITYKNTSALLEGDAERKTEKQLVQEEPAADLLKVAHHGSATSTTPELLASVKPRYAVISVGTNNVYGHPRPQVLDRLNTARVETYRTDQNGAVSFYLDGTTVAVQPVVPHP
jgi:competence protein ComEC